MEIEIKAIKKGWTVKLYEFGWGKDGIYFFPTRKEVVDFIIGVLQRWK